MQELQRRLSARFHALPTGGADRPSVAPVVAALGAADALAAGAREAMARSGATVHVTTGGDILVGPWGPGTGTRPACGHCLAMRWQRLRQRYERESLETAAAIRPAAVWPLLPAHLVDAVWALYRTCLAPADEPGPATGPAGPDLRWRGGSRVSRVALDTLGTATYPIIAEPLCPACADRWSTVAPEPWLAWKPEARTKPAPDSYRLCSPADYRLPDTALANPVCGVLSAGLGAHLVSPTTAPVSGRVWSTTFHGLLEMSWAGQENSFSSSRDVAFLEGLERYVGMRRRRPGGFLVAAYEEIADQALDPRACGAYDPQAYARDPRLVPFDPAARVSWAWGYSLRDQRPILVPVQMAHYGDGTAADGFLRECSNGCASGASLEEALLFALLELVERDSFLLGWYGKPDLTELDLTTAGDPTTLALIDRAALLGYDVRAFDNRIDLDLPVVTAVAVRRDGGGGLLSFASAASLDAGTALRGALTETITYIPQLPLKFTEHRDRIESMARDFHEVRALADHSALFTLPAMAEHAAHYLAPRQREPVRQVYDSWRERGPRSADLRDDLVFCQRELERAGFDVIVVDQTGLEHEELGLVTLRAIVPGLLPIDFGWSKQRALGMPRMFSAFRRAGWRDTDLTEAELHLVPHPFP